MSSSPVQDGILCIFYNLKYCDLNRKFILAQVFMNLLVPVYVRVHNIKVCSSKCLWGSECDFEKSVWYVEAVEAANNNKHDFFSRGF